MDHPQWRDVYVAATARGLSICGDLLAATALTLVLTQRGASGYVVGALLLGAALPPALLARPAGRIADRVDSRLVVVIVAPLQSLCCLAMLTTTTPAVLIGLNTLLAVGVAVTQPVFSALTPAMVGVDNLPRANAVMQTANSLGLLAGPLLAGLIVGTYGLRVPLALDAVSFLAIAAAGMAIRTRRNQAPKTTESASDPRRIPDAAPDSVWRDRPLALTLLVAGAVVAAVNVTDVAIVFFVRRTLDASAMVYGVVMAGWMAGLMPGSWLAARRVRSDGDGSGDSNGSGSRSGDMRFFARLTAGLLLVCAAIIGTGAAPGAAWVLPAFVVGGIGNGLLGSAAATLVARRTVPEARGRAFAALGAVMNGAMACGYLSGSVLLSAFSPRPVILGSGLAALGFSTAMIRVRRPE